MRRGRSAWPGYLLRRAYGAVLVLALLVVLTFLLVRLVPGDPARVMLGIDATPEQVAQVHSALGLDRPLPAQFVDYVRGLFTGDFGTSFRTSRPVSETISQRLPVTAALAAAALGVVLVIGFPAGILVGFAESRGKARAVSKSFTSLTSFISGVPEYVMGTALVVVFALKLGVLPAQGGGDLRGYVLPALAVGLGASAVFARLVRNETVSTLEQEYILTALSKRISTWRLLTRHVLPNVVTSTLSLAGLMLVGIVGGTVITENVFNIPGLGSEVVNAVTTNDYPTVQGILLVLGTLAVLVNLTVDVILGLIDPRVLTEGRR